MRNRGRQRVEALSHRRETRAEHPQKEACIMGTTAATKSVVGVAKKITALVAGMNKDFTAKNTLTVADVAMTQVQILAQLASLAALYAAVANAKSATKVAEAALQAALPAARTFIEGLEAAIKAQLGVRSPLLADFGIGIPGAKSSTRTAAQKAVSSALTKATKTVRGIIGSKQRSDITVSGKPGLVLVGPNGGEPVTVLPATPPGVPPGATGSVTGASTPAAAVPSTQSTATPAPAGSTTPTPSGSGSTGPASGG
jgi:hypothetical protein